MSKSSKALWILLGAASGLFTPVASQALSVDDVTLTSDASDVVITVRGDENLTAPSVNSYEGQLRVRFPAARVQHTVQVPGDGGAIANVELRAGSHETAVIQLSLGDDTKLAVSDLRLELKKNTVVMKIARDLLPPMKVIKGEAAKTAPIAAPVAAKATAVAAPAAAKPTANPAATKTAAAKPAAAAKKPLSGALAPSESPVPALLALSAVLGLAYLALRMFMKKRPELKSTPTIEVIAQKRMGARHQLVVVRAFGQDHLLSIHGTTTTHIAASEAGSEHMAIENAARHVASQRESAVSEKQRESRASEARETREAPTAKAEVPAGEETVFGGELLKLAIAQRKRDNTITRMTERKPAPAPVPEADPKEEEKVLSQAVAGLVRLRREAR